MPHPNQILGFDLPQKQIDYWLLPNGEHHKLGRWPTNGSLRADTRYRLFTRQFDFPVATRYLVHFHFEDNPPPGPEPSIDVWFWVDIDGGSGARYEASSDLGPFVPRINFLLTEEDPLFPSGFPGIQLIVEVFWGTTNFSTTYQWLYAFDHPFVNPIDTNRFPPDFEGGQPPGEEDPGRFIDVFGVSECYDFPTHPDLVEDFAAFNGIDAYISLAQLMTFTNNPFRLSCELRLNQTPLHWPILGKEATGGFFGMQNANIIFGNLTLPTTWTPITDTWVTWVYEFEPLTQLQHKLTIAGVVVRDATNSRQFPSFNNLGVYKHGVSGTLWADMDMRDLKIETGTPGNYTTLLDMPLRVNALDIGPQANHGTTFNMTLPST